MPNPMLGLQLEVVEEGEFKVVLLALFVRLWKDKLPLLAAFCSAQLFRGTRALRVAESGNLV